MPEAVFPDLVKDEAAADLRQTLDSHPTAFWLCVTYPKERTRWRYGIVGFDPEGKIIRDTVPKGWRIRGFVVRKIGMDGEFRMKALPDALRLMASLHSAATLELDLNIAMEMPGYTPEIGIVGRKAAGKVFFWNAWPWARMLGIPEEQPIPRAWLRKPKRRRAA